MGSNNSNNEFLCFLILIVVLFFLYVVFIKDKSSTPLNFDTFFKVNGSSNF